MEIRQIKGYHGTTRINAEKIVKEQRFVESNRNTEWLGKGVYFFAYIAHAKWWTTHGRYSKQTTAVLDADLKYMDEQILDLDDPDVLDFVNEFVADLVKAAESAGILDVGKVDLRGRCNDYKRWNFVCNAVKETIPEIGIISYTFRPNCPVGQSGYAQNQKQLCVSDHDIIREIRIVG